MRDDNCLFCRIVSGELPATMIYEDDDFIRISGSPAVISRTYVAGSTRTR